MPSADWSLPILSNPYSSILSALMQRDVDAITLCVVDPTNIPTGAIKYLRASDKFQEWNGSAWVDKVISLAGGGTGGNSATNARIALGLGSIATQNASAVAITGGSISGITLNANVITSGALALARGGTGVSLAIGANGTVLQSNGATVGFSSDGSLLQNLNASQLTSGTVPTARLPVNTTLQNKSTYWTTATNINNATWTDINHVSITPASNTNRVRLLFVINVYCIGGAGLTNFGLQLRISRGAAGANVIQTYTGIFLRALNSIASKDTVVLDFIDSPAVTSNIDYYVQGISFNNPNNSYVINGVAQAGELGASSLTASEIGPN